MPRRPLPNVLYERITAGAATAARRAATLRHRADKPTGNGRFAPSGPQLTRDQKHGMGPFVVLGGAVAVGIVLAKLIDWRSHAHPRN